MSTQCGFKTGSKKRNQLKLPQLRFVVADNWIDTLGMDAFRAWLKFHTWVDRTNADRGEDKIPYTIESVCKHLGMGKKKFYEKVMRPLWNHGLIDTMEYADYKQKGKKPVNIVVYESPFNKHETEVLELEKVRDYDKDYKSVSQSHGRKGGRPKKIVKKVTLKGFQMETSKVSIWKRQRFPNGNPIIKDLNNLNNYTNKGLTRSNNHQHQDNKKEQKVDVDEKTLKLISIFQEESLKEWGDDALDELDEGFWLNYIEVCKKNKKSALKELVSTIEYFKRHERKSTLCAVIMQGAKTGWR